MVVGLEGLLAAEHQAAFHVRQVITPPGIAAPLAGQASFP